MVQFAPVELSKKRKLLRSLPFPIGLLTALVALEAVSDPNTRHAVALLGVLVAGVGLGLNLRTIRSRRP